MNDRCPITNEHGFCMLREDHDLVTQPHVFGHEFDRTITLVGRDVNVALEALRFEVMWRSEHGWDGPLVDVPRALAERLEKGTQ